jgi:integrase
MPRKGKRVKVSKGVYRDGSGFEVRATVGGHTYTARMPPDSTLKELQSKRAALEHQGHTDTPRTIRGTLRADAPRYLALVAHLASHKERRAHLDAWMDRVGDVQRHRITSRDVLEARVAWLQSGKAPKTVNHRVGTLRHLYRTLDGPTAATPCDDVTPLEVPRSPITRISPELILAVDQKLQEMEAKRTGPPWDAKTRARFRVLVSTGKRPVEVMRAQPADVNLDARVWVPRDAKGGYTPGVYLNEDMLEAWRLFIAAEAWGRFSSGNFARTLRSAGWPEKVRPYQARHTMWITASEMGIDLADISIGAGHRDPRMTRKAYVPVLNSRLQQMSERMDGRFGGWGKSVAAKRGTDAKPQDTND